MTVTTYAGPLLSVNVGMPRDVEWEGRTVRTAIWKSPVAGRRMVRRLNIDGDGQGDLTGHGGVNRAVFVYQIEPHRYWRTFLNRDDFTYGQFGENFTVEGLGDDEVLHRRPLPHRFGAVRGQPAAGHVLPGRHPHAGAPDAVPAGRAPPSRLRPPGPRRGHGRGRRHDRARRTRPGGDDGSGGRWPLYLPKRAHGELIRALQIPALSEGWQGSFRELLEQAPDGGATEPAVARMAAAARYGDRPRERQRDLGTAGAGRRRPGRARAAGPVPDGTPAPGPGGGAALAHLLLSGAPNAESYRISVKREPHGAVSGYLCTRLRAGDVIEAGAPRGSFVLRPGDRPVVLISAGVGATPVLAMLHVLAAGRSARPVWWVYGARNGSEHPFEHEARTLLGQLPDAHRIVCYSHPRPQDGNFDVAGRVTVGVLDKAGVPAGADYYLCGPAQFMHDIAAALTARVPPPTVLAKRSSGPPTRERPASSPRPSALRIRLLRAGPGAGYLIQPQQPVGRLGPGLRQPPRVRGGLRRPRAVEPPDRRLPHVRDRAGQRRGQLPARPARATRARQRAHLLLPARPRDHARSLATCRCLRGSVRRLRPVPS